MSTELKGKVPTIQDRLEFTRYLVTHGHFNEQLDQPYVIPKDKQTAITTAEQLLKKHRKFQKNQNSLLL